MPNYFFDVDDGDIARRDDEGSELLGLKEARAEAISLLPNIAREKLPDGDLRFFVVTVRDATGQNVFRATLYLAAVWLISPPA